MNKITNLACIVSAVAAGTAAQAQDVRITTFKSDSTFVLNGQTFTIARNQDTTAILQGDFARTSRECPPDCIQPMSAAAGVATIGELELLAFLETQAADGAGLLIDTRLPGSFAQGTVPSAVNIPFLTLAAENRFRDDILRALGAIEQADGTWDFSAALDLVLFCNGAWSKDAPTAVEHLTTAGYPADRLHYYRGGMQAWLGLGMTTRTAANPG